jgi:signal transduction histidine kinase
MQPSSWSTDATVAFGQPHSGVSPLVGRWLLLARLVWWVVTMLVVVLFVASLPSSFAYLQTLCLGVSCNGPQLTPEHAHQLHSLGLSLPLYATYFITINSVFFVTYFVVACVLFWQRADDRMAFIASLFLVSFGGATFPGTLDALAALNPTWGLFVAIARFLGIVFLSLFSYLFPDGRFAPSWIRFVALVGLLVLVPDTLFPGSPLSFSHMPRLLVFVLFLGYFACPVAVQIYRYRRVSNVTQRQQTKWVVFGLTAATVGFLGLLLLTATVSPTEKNNALASLIVVSSYYFFFLLIPLSIGIAILRYRLWDIDVLIKRSLVYGALTLCIIGLYILLVGSLGALFRTNGNLVISLIATGVVAVIVQPLRHLLQRGVNRLLYGLRDEPYVVLAGLGQRLKSTLDPDAVLSTIVETVREALKLSYAAIEVTEGAASALAASSGTPPTKEALRLPLVYQMEPVGTLIIAPRGRDNALTPADLHLLNDLAYQIGSAVHTVRLTSDLQLSRERLVTAREEERRRLRRDLHDGLGPALASIPLKLDAARNLLVRDPSAADALLVDLKKQTQTAVADIRRLVYELRPPSLDELGLVPALREQAEQYSHDGLHISIDAPEQLPSLPAAVEVAAYRIAQEAMTNVVRHAQAHTCSIHFALNNGLRVEVCDDGRGIPAGQRAGVGLTSMRERAAELGGRCEIEAIPAGGTRIFVLLPLPKAVEWAEGGE